MNLYGFVGNNPISKNDRFGLYEIDVHYYLTYYLALQVGCFNDAEAREIAEGNQHTDEDAGYLPGAGWSLTGGTDYKQLAQNKLFHALHEEALPGVGSDLLWSNAKMSKSGFVFGRYLHHLQDTFSHEGFTNSTWGHTPVSWLLGGKFGTHATDKASTDKFKTLRMAKYTFAAMVRFANEIKCGCTPKGWGAGIEYDVWRFSMVDVGFPYNQLADIEGDIAAGVKNSYLASPLALQQKANILNIEMRVK